MEKITVFVMNIEFHALFCNKDLLDSKDLLDQQVSLVQQALQVLRDHQDRLGSQEIQVPKVSLDLLETLAQLDLLELQVARDLQDLEVTLDLLDHRVKLVP